MESTKKQVIGCRIEIGVPTKHLNGSETDSFWLAQCAEVLKIRSLGQCPVISWQTDEHQTGEEIPDFNSWGYDPLPQNLDYKIRRFWAECVTPECDIFGVEKLRKGEAGNPTTYRFTLKNGTVIVIVITGRNVTDMREKYGWICTDPDCCQMRRKAVELDPDGNVYELYQVQEMPVDEIEICVDGVKIYKIAHDFVYFSEIDIESVLECYGYESLESFQKEYEDDWKGILAECQFELDASSLENLSNHMPLMTYNDAVRAILNLIEQ